MPENDGGLPCRHCEDDRRIDPRGFQAHMRQTHDLSPEMAKAEFEQAQRMAGKALETDNSGDPVSPPSGGSGSDAPAADDPTIRDLEKQIAIEERRQRLQRLREADVTDDDGDLLDTLERLQESGLLGGNDQESGTNSALMAEIQRLRQKVDNGGSQSRSAPAPAPSGGDSDLLSTALRAGIEDQETLASLAEQAPEVKRAELDLKRDERRWERRKQFLDAALENVSEGMVNTAMELLSGMAAQRQERSAQGHDGRPVDADPAEWRDTPDGPPGDGESAEKARDAYQSPDAEPKPDPEPTDQRSAARERMEEMTGGGEDDDAGPPGEFRSPAGS